MVNVLDIPRLFLPLAHAQGLLVWCGNLCGNNASGEEIVIGALTLILAIFVALAGSLATIFFIYGTLQMVMPWSEGAAENGKKTIINALKGLAIAFLSGFMVEVIRTETFAGGGADPFISFVRGISRILQTLFNGLFFLALLYAGIQMVMDRGKGEGYSKGIEILKWSIIAGVLMNLSKAILDAFVNLPCTCAGCRLGTSGRK
mgnify:CR=1 FL=1